MYKKSQNRKKTKYKKHITWVSIPYTLHINQQLKKAFTNNSVSFHSSSGPKLKNILCAANKTKQYIGPKRDIQTEMFVQS